MGPKITYIIPHFSLFSKKILSNRGRRGILTVLVFTMGLKSNEPSDNFSKLCQLHSHYFIALFTLFALPLVT